MTQRYRKQQESEEELTEPENESRRGPNTRRVKRFDPVTRNYTVNEADLSDRRHGSDRYYTADGELITGA